MLANGYYSSETLSTLLVLILCNFLNVSDSSTVCYVPIMNFVLVCIPKPAVNEFRKYISIKNINVAL